MSRGGREGANALRHVLVVLPIRHAPLARLADPVRARGARLGELGADDEDEAVERLRQIRSDDRGLGV